MKETILRQEKLQNNFVLHYLKTFNECYEFSVYIVKILLLFLLF